MTMKRMTYFECGKWRLKIGDTEYSGEAVDLLAAYEDTGLEPEKINKREGRVTIEPKARECPKCGKMRLFPRIDWKYYYCYSCKTQFTREEAEAALEGMKNG